MTPASPSKDDRPPTDGISLLEFFDRILEEHDKAHMAEHKGVELAAKELERRLDGLNELRSEVVKDREQFSRKDEVLAVAEKVTDALETRTQNVEAHFARIEEKLDERIASNQKESDERLRSFTNLMGDLSKRIAALETKSVSEDALRTYKRVVYGAMFAAIVSIIIAFIGALTK